jgi:hypothetical protein
MELHKGVKEMQLKKRIRDAFWKIAFAIISHRDSKRPLAKFFPACNHKNYFYNNLNFEGRDYHTKIFLERMANPLRIDFANFRSEILPGTFLSSDGKYNLAVSSPSVMPVCLTGSDYAAATAENRISVRHNDQKYTLRNLVYDRFYYLRLDKPGSVCSNYYDDGQSHKRTSDR